MIEMTERQHQEYVRWDEKAVALHNRILSKRPDWSHGAVMSIMWQIVGQHYVESGDKMLPGSFYKTEFGFAYVGPFIEKSDDEYAFSAS